MARTITHIMLTDREMELLDQALNILGEDAQEDANEGRYEEICALGSVIDSAKRSARALPHSD